MDDSAAAAAAALAAQNAVIQSLVPDHLETGVLIPLKTTLELRDDYVCSPAYVTRCPVKSANAVIRSVSRPFPHPWSLLILTSPSALCLVWVMSKVEFQLADYFFFSLQSLAHSAT